MGNDSIHDTESHSAPLKGPHQQSTSMVHEESETGQSFPVNSLGDRFKRVLYGFKVETRGIERVDEDEQHDQTISNAATVVSSH
jgi:hypothetical protein